MTIEWMGHIRTNLLLCGFVIKCFFNASLLMKWRLKWCKNLVSSFLYSNKKLFYCTEDNTSVMLSWFIHWLKALWLDSQCIKYDHQPTFLGVTLDRTLSFKPHLTKTATKLKNRNNLLTKLAGSSWAANADTPNIHISSLLLCGRVLCSTVASLGWVSPGAATEGVTPLFFSWKTWRAFFAHRCHYHYHFLLLPLGGVSPFLPVRPHFSTILCKFAHKNFFPSGVTPVEGVTRGGAPPPSAPL